MKGIIKVCGITHPEDAVHAARMGVNWIGLLLSKESKKFVETALAQEIAMAAQENGATPIGVFVNERLEEILVSIEKIGIHKVQLHGAESRKALAFLPEDIEPVLCVEVDQNGNPSEAFPRKQSDYIVYDSLRDSLRPGRDARIIRERIEQRIGMAFPWERFKPRTSNPWILAGGLNPTNVKDAILLLQPHGVDVSSGVSSKSSLRKDPDLVQSFVQAVREAYEFIQ